MTIITVINYFITIILVIMIIVIKKSLQKQPRITKVGTISQLGFSLCKLS